MIGDPCAARQLGSGQRQRVRADCGPQVQPAPWALPKIKLGGLPVFGVRGKDNTLEFYSDKFLFCHTISYAYIKRGYYKAFKPHHLNKHFTESFSDQGQIHIHT